MRTLCFRANALNTAEVKDVITEQVMWFRSAIKRSGSVWYESLHLDWIRKIWKISYFRISNPLFVSKLIEKVVARHIKEQLEHTGLHDNEYSVYRRGHSTETTLLEVYSEKSMAGLIMLDLSSSFGVIDHLVLLFLSVFLLQIKHFGVP